MERRINRSLCLPPLPAHTSLQSIQLMIGKGGNWGSSEGLLSISSEKYSLLSHFKKSLMYNAEKPQDHRCIWHPVLLHSLTAQITAITLKALDGAQQPGPLHLLLWIPCPVLPGWPYSICRDPQAVTWESGQRSLPAGMSAYYKDGVVFFFSFPVTYKRSATFCWWSSTMSLELVKQFVSLLIHMDLGEIWTAEF